MSVGLTWNKREGSSFYSSTKHTLQLAISQKMNTTSYIQKSDSAVKTQKWEKMNIWLQKRLRLHILIL